MVSDILLQLEKDINPACFFNPFLNKKRILQCAPAEIFISPVRFPRTLLNESSFKTSAGIKNVLFGSWENWDSRVLRHVQEGTPALRLKNDAKLS
jgi:hypothetical protein